MKFVDQVDIRAIGGRGGDGCLSFRREKFVPHGGPDGGDGGDGGSVYLQPDPDLNTLMHLRTNRLFRAGNGKNGSGRNRTGLMGADVVVPVPLGTSIYDLEDDTLVGDLVSPDQRMLIAQGGVHGLGNIRYKSSTNRTPRKIKPGKLGEDRSFRLELNLLADVGVLGYPNVGKSSLVSTVSSSKTKVSDYPFTTLHPSLGVVKVDSYRNFVIADIPGLVEGAAGGRGLGIDFLRHLSRTRLLLHMIDIASTADEDLATINQSLLNELSQFDQALADKPRWIVFNKIDLMDPTQLDQHCDTILHGLNWDGPQYRVSTATKHGLDNLCNDIMHWLEQQAQTQLVPDEPYDATN